MALLNGSPPGQIADAISSLFFGTDYRATLSWERHILFDEWMVDVLLYGPIQPGAKVPVRGSAWFESISRETIECPSAFLAEVRLAASRFIGGLVEKGRVPAWFEQKNIASAACLEAVATNPTTTTPQSKLCTRVGC